MATPDNLNGYRTQPLYTFGEAARLTGVSPGTARNWLLGYIRKERTVTPEGFTTQDRPIGPLFNSASDGPAMVSFLQLIEIVVAARFRKAERVPFQTVRKAHQNGQRDFGLPYPFAHLRLEAIGGHIVRRLHGEQPGVSLQAVDSPAQWTIPGLVLDLVHQLDYERKLAARWYPVGKQVPIVVDPQVSAGRPTVRGRGVTIATLHWRWKGARQTIDFIAQDFVLPRDQVERALQYAENVAA